MTPSEFLQLHLQGVYPMQPSRRINVNIDKNIPAGQGLQFAGRSAQALEDYYVLNISVNTQGLVGGVTELMYDVLADISKIRFQFKEHIYDLEVTGGVSYITFGTQFFMYTVNPFLIPGDIAQNIVSGEVIDDVLIDFTPFIGDLKDRLREYQALLNNTQQSRDSYKIRKSKRDVYGARPTNFLPIYSGSAEKANVQDSLYYDTGWKNSRYDGTKSTQSNYGGVVPSTSIRSTEGYVNPDSVPDSVICATEEQNRIYQEVLHTDRQELPSITTYDIGSVLKEGLSNSTTNKTFNISPLAIGVGTLDIGDIIQINSELMRVEDIFPSTAIYNTVLEPVLTLTVRRAIKDTALGTHGVNNGIDKVYRIDMYDFQVETSKLQVTDNSKILIRDTGDIFHTDEYGTVFQVTTCP